MENNMHGAMYRNVWAILTENYKQLSSAYEPMTPAEEYISGINVTQYLKG